MSKNGATIPTEPREVYAVLDALLKSYKLPLHEHAAVAFALGAFPAAFPVSFKTERKA